MRRHENLFLQLLPAKKSVQKKVSKYQPVACSLYHMSDIQINSMFRRHAEVSGKYQGNIRKYQGTECRTEASTCRGCKVPPCFSIARISERISGMPCPRRGHLVPRGSCTCRNPCFWMPFPAHNQHIAFLAVSQTDCPDTFG